MCSLGIWIVIILSLTGSLDFNLCFISPSLSFKIQFVLFGYKYVLVYGACIVFFCFLLTDGRTLIL